MNLANVAQGPEWSQEHEEEASRWPCKEERVAELRRGLREVAKRVGKLTPPARARGRKAARSPSSSPAHSPPPPAPSPPALSSADESPAPAARRPGPLGRKSKVVTENDVEELEVEKKQSEIEIKSVENVEEPKILEPKLDAARPNDPKGGVITTSKETIDISDGKEEGKHNSDDESRQSVEKDIVKPSESEKSSSVKKSALMILSDSDDEKPQEKSTPAIKEKEELKKVVSENNGTEKDESGYFKETDKIQNIKGKESKESKRKGKLIDSDSDDFPDPVPADAVQEVSERRPSSALARNSSRDRSKSRSRSKSREKVKEGDGAKEKDRRKSTEVGEKSRRRSRSGEKEVLNKSKKSKEEDEKQREKEKKKLKSSDAFMQDLEKSKHKKHKKHIREDKRHDRDMREILEAGLATMTPHESSTPRGDRPKERRERDRKEKKDRRVITVEDTSKGKGINLDNILGGMTKMVEEKKKNRKKKEETENLEDDDLPVPVPAAQEKAQPQVEEQKEKVELPENTWSWTARKEREEKMRREGVQEEQEPPAERKEDQEAEERVGREKEAEDRKRRERDKLRKEEKEKRAKMRSGQDQGISAPAPEPTPAPDSDDELADLAPVPAAEDDGEEFPDPVPADEDDGGDGDVGGFDDRDDDEGPETVASLDDSRPGPVKRKYRMDDIVSRLNDAGGGFGRTVVPKDIQLASFTFPSPVPVLPCARRQQREEEERSRERRGPSTPVGDCPESSEEQDQSRDRTEQSRARDPRAAARREEQERRRTPSPFLSCNKHYPWLYDPDYKEEKGVRLEESRIKDAAKRKGQKKRGEEEKENTEGGVKPSLGPLIDQIISGLKKHEMLRPPPPPEPPGAPPPPPPPRMIVDGEIRNSPGNREQEEARLRRAQLLQTKRGRWGRQEQEAPAAPEDWEYKPQQELRARGGWAGAGGPQREEEGRGSKRGALGYEEGPPSKRGDREGGWQDGWAGKEKWGGGERGSRGEYFEESVSRSNEGWRGRGSHHGNTWEESSSTGGWNEERNSFEGGRGSGGGRWDRAPPPPPPPRVVEDGELNDSPGNRWDRAPAGESGPAPRSDRGGEYFEETSREGNKGWNGGFKTNEWEGGSSGRGWGKEGNSYGSGRGAGQWAGERGWGGENGGSRGFQRDHDGGGRGRSSQPPEERQYPVRQSAPSAPVQAPGLEERRLDKAHQQWEELLRAHLTDCRLAVDQEVQDKKSLQAQSQDLGTRYNQPRLNQKVPHGGGRPGLRPVFLCHDKDGSASFECTVCDIMVSGMKTLESHMGGKKHLAKLGQHQVEEGAVSDPVAATTSLVPERGLLSRLLPLLPGAPLPGSGFLAEVLLGRAEPEYHCLLCSAVTTVREVVPHLRSAAHQLAFLAQARPEVYLMFAARSSPASWGAAIFDNLDFQVVHGPLPPSCRPRCRSYG